MTLSNHDDDDFEVGLLGFLDGEAVQIAGAAADSAELEASLARFPRLARLALIEAASPGDAHKHLAADLGEIDAALGARAGAVEPYGDPDAALALAAELDREAAASDRPQLRPFADGLRLQALPVKVAAKDRRWLVRLAQAMAECVRRARALERKSPAERRRLAELQVLAAGWSALACGCTHDHARWASRAFDSASSLGALLTNTIGEAAVAAYRAASAGREPAAAAGRADAGKEVPTAAVAIPAGHVVVARLGDEAKRARTRELSAGIAAILDAPVPLAAVPDLDALRVQLVGAFPQAVEVIDAFLGDLLGRGTVKLLPTLLVGPPGAGKSSFAAFLAGALGTGLWRADATQDAAVIAGTSRRWSTAEPSHMLLAIARARHANPIVLIDEIEKAPTRTDNGRVWDQLLGLLEPATAAAYPDPCLQVETDLSHVSLIATANDLCALPPPLRDRMRVLAFPEPGPEHLDALLARLVPNAAAERRIDPRFVPPLDGEERAAIAAAWRGGSVRLLQRYLDVVLRARDAGAVRH